MSESATKAVFLSYASQDAESALRLGAGLRASGVEVWLDQEGGLAGGDVWDRKIRDQIAACALFVPLVSTNTQARKEGYFRLEWKLAAQRTHMMSERTAFLLPVVIDATRDTDADVPGEFRAVQWTWLPAGTPTPQFVEHVQRLLAPAGVARVSRPVGSDPMGPETQATPKRVAAKWPWGVLAVCFVGLGLAFLLKRKSAPVDSAPPPVAKREVTPSAPAKSLAVLPFANLSTEKENEFFADGMHDELLTALAKIGALKVISRTSVLIYRDPAKRGLTLKQIAAELGVANVLEGSVSRSADNVRINVKLIDAATDQQRWAETFNLKAVIDVFQVQAEISAQIAQALAAAISPELKQRLAYKLTSNPAAYDLYLRARRWRESDRQELSDNAKWEELVVSPLEQAVALDPTFAAAYAELSQVHSYLYWWPNLDPTPARLAKAKAAVDQALRLDSALPVAHSALGYYHYVGSLDFARATEEFAIALAAMPGDAEVLLFLGATQRRQGRWAEATANLERAFAINPRNLDISVTWVATLLAQRQHTRAEQAAERALAINPTIGELLRLKAHVRFARDGDRMRQRSAFDAIPRKPGTEHPDPRLRQFEAAIEDGRHADAVRIFEEPAELSAQNARGSDLILRAYFFAATAIGERDKVRVRALAAIAETKPGAAERREAWEGIAKLALYHAYAGRPDEARRLADRALELMPVERDAFSGPLALHEVAQVHLALGDRDRALALLDQALSVPSRLVANELCLEPWWAPLRDDPRFKAALAKAAPRD